MKIIKSNCYIYVYNNICYIIAFNTLCLVIAVIYIYTMHNTFTTAYT